MGVGLGKQRFSVTLPDKYYAALAAIAKERGYSVDRSASLVLADYLSSHGYISQEGK